MNRTGRLTAVLLLVLWIGMISAPVVFGSPECTCPDCTGAFCAMKKHARAEAQRIVHLSCHETTSKKGSSLQKADCHHEMGPVAFSYHAVLTVSGQAVQQSVQFALTGFVSQLSGGNGLPETPPPKHLSC
ncbi:MAG TPA: hypothetical protein VLR94_06235 [Acidobacteriota bacterium]|nr:hypothetical protein [Acidobacteriota bacterium]